MTDWGVHMIDYALLGAKGRGAEKYCSKRG
mgnify:CR=1 FL=1